VVGEALLELAVGLVREPDQSARGTVPNPSSTVDAVR
jgi:hypothetical protein